MSLLQGALAACMALCLTTTALADEVVRVGGTGMGIALVRKLAAAYRAEHPGHPIWIPESIGTSGAVKGLAAGRLDVGILARPLKPGEVDGAVSVQVCRTPLVFFTSSRRRDISLTRAALPALFANTLPPFSQGEVRMLLRPATDTEFIRLLEIYPEIAPAMATAREARGAVLAVTDQEAMDAVENSRSLVGYGALAPMTAEGRALTVVPMDGLTPGVEALESGRHLHDLPLHLALPAHSTEEAKAFVAYARSPAAAALLQANGCLPSPQAR